MTIRIGLLLFPRLQQLDLTGPYDVFAQIPGVEMHLVWKTCAPLQSSSGMIFTPDTTFDECPPLDVLCIPGGAGVDQLLEDDETLEFVRRQAGGTRFMTSVCSGALVLGAAGLLEGRRATTHWASHHMLGAFGAIPVHERVVRDGNLITGGGITAGIDFALTLTAELTGENEAMAIQLQLEYAPAPPFDAGSQERAPRAVVDQVRARSALVLARREAIVARVSQRLVGGG